MMTTTTSTFRRFSSNPRGASIAGPVAGPVKIRWSTTDDGDFCRRSVIPVELEARRRALVDLPWTMLDQHHGTDVVYTTLADPRDGAPGDIAVTDDAGLALGCWVGDCAPVVLVGAKRRIATVHAGWKGLAGGVIDAAVAAFDEPISIAVVGPAIGPCCYEFGKAELELVARGVHQPSARLVGRTRWGGRALAVVEAVRLALARHDIDLVEVGGCTGCTYPGFSHRVRGDRQRHVVVAWRPIDGGAGDV